MMIDPDAIARAITDAPAWALIGLTMPQERLREDACRAVAVHLYDRLYAPGRAETDQLALPL